MRRPGKECDKKTALLDGLQTIIRSVNGGRAFTMPTLCNDCNATGLPILPVRYCPVPISVTPSVPGWASADRVSSVPLGKELHYALRILRAGFVYLFYSKNQYGSNRWECYAVTDEGLLLKQPDPLMAAIPSAPFSCARQGHTNARLHHLLIERPDKCGTTWIAFSEHKWSSDTLQEYAQNGKLRDARMQTLHPAKMAAGAKHSHGTPASAAALEDVLEYSASSPAVNLPHNAVVARFSKEDGSFDVSRLSGMSTRYPWALRQGQAQADLSAMQVRAKKADGTHNAAHVLALWDAVGIAHELNGYRNDAAGWLAKYGQERELQLSASNAVTGLKLALEKRVDDAWNTIASRSASQPDLIEHGMLAPAVTRYAKGSPSELGQPLVELDNKFKAGQVSEAAYRSQRSQIIAATSNDPAAMEAAYAKIDQHRRELAHARQRNLGNNKLQDKATSWKRYEERLSMSALHDFDGNWRKLREQADRFVEQRTQVLVAWLRAPLLLDSLEDFHPKCETDGVKLEGVVGHAVFGIGACTSGAKQLEEWIAKSDASDKTNLLWRAMAMNLPEAAVEINAALRLAYGAPKPLTMEAWEHAFSQVKWNKIADLGKKSLTAFNTQSKAINDAASGIKPVPGMHGLDQIFATVGGRWVQPFKWTVDSVNEVMLRTLLMVRSGVDPLAAKALGAWDALHAAADRESLIRRLKNQDYYLSAAAKAQYEEHAKKWATLRSDIEVPDAKKKSFNAARDARLALVVAVFEAFNLYKASAKAAKEPGNEKVQAQLTAAKLSTAAASIDVLSNMVKGLAVAGDKAVSYQVLKFGGGALSATASAYGACLDFEATGGSWSERDYRMATLFGIRAVFQGTSATLTVLTSLSYCSPLIETFGKRFGERLAGQLLSAAAKRLLLARAALVFASLEVSIFLLVITLFIWYFEDDALQKWCDRSAFGIKRSSLKDSFQSATTQVEKYQEALKEAS
jgi:hypothetical protein